MQTTIALESKTRDALKQLGAKTETYDDILNRLVEIAKMHEFYRQQRWILENEKFTPVSRL